MIFLGDRERDARNIVCFGLRVSEPESLRLHKSAKNRIKNPNSLRSDMRIFAPNADFHKLRGSMSPANANQMELVPELVAARPGGQTIIERG